MSPLTKALVLLVTILSIVLVALVVPFVANTDDLQGEIADLKMKVQVADASANKARQEVARLTENQSASQSELQNTLTQLRGKNLELTQAAAKFEADAKEAASKVDSLSASLVLLGGTQDNLTTLLNNQTEALKAAQSNNVNLKKQNAQLAQRNNDLDAQVTGLTRTNRSLTEKIADLTGQIANGGEGAAVGTTASGIGGGEVSGQITGIQTVDDIQLAEFNVGTNDGVSPNTKFIIHRNNQYVGTATVKTVDETVSIAKIESVKGGGNLRVGDAVITGIGY